MPHILPNYEENEEDRMHNWVWGGILTIKGVLAQSPTTVNITRMWCDIFILDSVSMGHKFSSSEWRCRGFNT